jgi:hypothetical protein
MGLLVKMKRGDEVLFSKLALKGRVVKKEARPKQEEKTICCTQHPIPYALRLMLRYQSNSFL